MTTMKHLLIGGIAALAISLAGAAPAQSDPSWTMPNLVGTGLQGAQVIAIPAQAYPAMPPGVQGPFTVIKVVDGDTIWVDNGVA